MRKIRVISFKLEDKAVISDQPSFKMIEHESLKDLIVPDDLDPMTMPMQNYTTKIFERITVRDGRKTRDYFVNFEEASFVMPILEGIVNNQTKLIAGQKIDLEVLNAQLLDRLRRVEGYWFNRLWNWILKNHEA